jgi:phage terminase large subunit-like protein
MVDNNENQKPKKSSKNAKIDPVISMLEALGVMMEQRTFKHFFEVI